MRRPVAVFCVFGMLVLYLLYSLFGGRKYDSLVGSKVTYTGYAADIKESANGISLYLKGGTITDADAHGKVNIIVYPGCDYDFKIGQKVRVSGTLSRFGCGSNYGQMDFEKYYMSKGYSYGIYDADVISVGTNHSYAGEVLHELKSYLSDITDNYYHEKYAGIIKGMLLGDKSDIDTEIKDRHINCLIRNVLCPDKRISYDLSYDRNDDSSNDRNDHGSMNCLLDSLFILSSYRIRDNDIRTQRYPPKRIDDKSDYRSIGTDSSHCGLSEIPGEITDDSNVSRSE